jgi:single-strand selective monofunctional uracil DNA glycosylase
MTTTHERLVAAARWLADGVDRLVFSEPVTHVYNPLRYAWDAHHRYLTMAPAAQDARVLFLGMNPGPWGMAQTGVPFGQVEAVRDWLGINVAVGKPPEEHPKRPIEGFACRRSEVSGERLWGLFRDRFGDPSQFFREHFVVNYCPLVFMEATGRNRTPDKLPSGERERLDTVCDEHLRQTLAALEPEFAVGVGAYAEACLQRVAKAGGISCRVVRVLHPSPASPLANRGWAGQATRELVGAGIWRSY